MVVGVPIAISMGIAAMTAIAVKGLPLIGVMQKMFGGLDSFPLIAVPFFILAAELMSGGALTEVLLRFAAQFVGHRRGGLGHTNILTLTFFSGISGSAMADAAGPGSMLIKMMRDSGYLPAYAAALTASIAVVGPIIPPSILMIIYALADPGVSVIGLYWAGLIPGVMIAAGLAMVNHVISIRRNYRSDMQAPGAREMLLNTWRAIPALALPAIILGGIQSGAFTPTEASVVAVFYALIAGRWIYATLTWDKLPGMLLRSAMLTASVLLIVSVSNAFAWVLTIAQVPQSVAQYVASLNLSPLSFLFAVNVLLLLFGIFIEPLPGVMILVPILAPMAAALGIDPLHFAIIVIVNLTLGMITPPVGGLLFVVSIVSRTPLSGVVREIWPLMWAEIGILSILTVFPACSIWLPHFMGR
ncbi:MAG: TRAP transporter large permease [Betaproteobacteria bacterium]|nr:TRAP transporter large permease [Betaproteobacteria bacterium]